MNTELPPLSLYIHVPWCEKKCPYCDFNSHQIRNKIPEKEYIAALVNDLEQSINSGLANRPLNSIFIGGGTPSLLSPDAYSYLFEKIFHFFPALNNELPSNNEIEITLEANPGSVDRTKLEAYRQIGINRISLGVQSFNDRHLQQIGRIHDKKGAINAIEILADTFPRFNLDLMYGLPTQTLAEAKSDLLTAISFPTEHLSFYQLTIEENTAFAFNPPTLPNSEVVADIEEELIYILKENGWKRYEIAAFAKNSIKSQCQHNLNYWQFGDYLGIGAGAHSKITHDLNNFTSRKNLNNVNNLVTNQNNWQIIRQIRHKHPQQYMREQNHLASTQILNQRDLIIEFMMNSLRLIDGFSLELFSQRTGLSTDNIKKSCAIATKEKLLEINENKHIRPTARGIRYLNVLLQHFL